MIQIDDKIVSLDILKTNFCCDINICKGCCCVEGNSGAPLDEDEIDILEQEYDNYKEYLNPQGTDAINDQGFFVIDTDGDYTTPLINNSECAYSIVNNGITICAIEKAYLDCKTKFRKPISCHLYPIRVAKFKNGTYGLNYHRWNICTPALRLGENISKPLYIALKEPIIRKFGPGFFQSLEEVSKLLEEK